jgi:hypothetical protein
MTTKKNTTNGLAQDMIRLHSLNDRTQKSSCQYYLNKWVKDIDWNTNQKELRIADFVAQQEELVEKHKAGEALDNDQMLKNEMDIEWLQRQIEFNSVQKDYLQQAVKQLFPEELKKSEDVYNKTESILAKYSK